MTTHVEIEIEGYSPLLCNRFTDAAMEAATNRTSRAHPGDDGTPREIAEGKLYTGCNGHKGKPIIPSMNMLACIREGGRYHKHAGSKVTTLKKSLVPACVEIVDDEILIQNKQPWSVDIRAVVNPKTGGRFGCARPRFDDWKLKFGIALDSGTFPEKLLRSVVDDAGQKVGLGDFRPDRKGPFGKFKVTHWKVLSKPKAVTK